MQGGPEVVVGEGVGAWGRHNPLFMCGVLKEKGVGGQVGQGLLMCWLRECLTLWYFILAFGA